MSQKPISRVEMRDFPGIVLNLDPDDLRPGTAREATNIATGTPAVLEVRRGFLVVHYEDQ